MADELKFDNRLGSKVDVQAPKMRANSEAMGALLAELRGEEDSIRMGGGAKAAEAQRAKGRLTVRERLGLLLDPEPLQTQVSEARPFGELRAGSGAPGLVVGSNFLELGLWAAYGMYSEYGGAPGAGVVTGLGRVSGRLCMIIANDATVKAGAFFPMTAKKVIRAQTIALENRIPTLYLVDSSGVFLPAAGGCVSRHG